IQRWNARRVGLLLGLILVVALFAGNVDGTLNLEMVRGTPISTSAVSCRDFEALWLQAEAVPTAAAVPCVRTLPLGWRVARVAVDLNAEANDVLGVISRDTLRAELLARSDGRLHLDP